MAKPKRSHTQRKPKETKIPRTFIEEQFELKITRIEGSIPDINSTNSSKEQGVIRTLKGIVSELRSRLEALISGVPEEGFSFLEEQQSFCTQKDEALKAAKQQVQNEHKQGDVRLSSMRKGVSDEMVRQNGELQDEVNRRFKLPKSKKDTKTPEKLETHGEILKYVNDQYLNIICQGGLTNILNELNETSTQDNPNYFKQVLGILKPILEAIHDSMQEASRQFSSGLAPTNWSGKIAAEKLEAELFKRKDEVEERLHAQMAHVDISIMIGKIKTFYRNIGRSLRLIDSSDKFKRFTSDEETDDSKRLYSSGESHILHLYANLRDKNIQKHGVYQSGLTFNDLGSFQGVFREICQELLQKDGTYSTPDDDGAELIALGFNEKFHDGTINFLIAEDIIKIIDELNLTTKTDKATSEHLQQITEYKKEALKELLKHAIDTFYASLLGKVVKGVRLQLTLQQSDQRPEHISISKELYEKLTNSFEILYISLFEEFEKIFDHNVEAKNDEVSYADRAAFERQLLMVVEHFLPELVQDLKMDGIEVEEADLMKYLTGTKLNIAALPYNVGSIADPIETFTPSQDYDETIYKLLLLDRYDNEQETLFTPREKAELTMVCGTRTKSVARIDVAELLPKLKEEGAFELWADKLNIRHHAGHPLRDASMVVREVTDILQNLADKKTGDKEASRIDAGLQERIDEVVGWAIEHFEEKKQRVAAKKASGGVGRYKETPLDKMVRILLVDLTENIEAYSLPDIEKMVCSLKVFKLNKEQNHKQNSLFALSDEELKRLILPPKRDEEDAGASTFYKEPDEIQAALRTLDGDIVRCSNELEAAKSKEEDLTELRGRLSTARQNFVDNSSDLEQAEADLKKLEKKLTEESNKQSGEKDFALIVALSGKCAEKQARVKALQDVVDDLKESTSGFEKKINELSQKIIDTEILDDLIETKKGVRDRILQTCRDIINKANGRESR